MVYKTIKSNVLMLAAILALALVALGGCGTQSVGATGAQATTVSSAAGPPADIPIYPGAKLEQQQSVTIKGTMVDTWTYTVNSPTATVPDVANFYEGQMPANGWTAMQSVPPKNVKGTYGGAVLTYGQQSTGGMPTPTGGPSHMYQRMAIIAIGANNANNPHQIGFVITQVR